MTYCFTLFITFMLCIFAAADLQFPNIKPATFPFPGVNGGKTIFTQTSPVMLACDIPKTPDLKLPPVVQWGPVLYEKNPIVPLADITYTFSRSSRPIYLTLEFRPKRYIRQVNVSCFTTSNEGRKTTYLTVEQYHNTSNVIINDGSKKVEVNSSDNMVHLECKGDGNPPPTIFEWFMKNEDGASYKLHESSKEISFKFKSNTSYMCQCKNYLNKKWAQSHWLDVSGFAIVKPSWISLAVSSIVFLFGRS